MKDAPESFTYGENVTLDFSIDLTNPNYYDDDILDKLNKTIYLHDNENITTNSTNCTLSGLKPGKYLVYYKTCNQKSNNITFKVMDKSKITTNETSYDYYDGLKNTVTLNIVDPSGENGIVDILVKDGDKYQKLLTCSNVQDGYNLTTDLLKDALENYYGIK